MSDNNSGIKASKRRQMEARRRRLRRRKRKRAMLLGGMLCTVCLILFGTIYGISHLLHKHTDTKEAVKTSPKQTAKSKDTSSSKEKIDTSAVKTQELVINTDTNSGKKKKGSSSKGPTTITISEGTEKVDNTACICYNVNIKYRRCFYDRTTAEISVKSIHGNI